MKDRIKAIRKSTGLNQSEFGAKIGVAQTTIAGYENGSRSLSDAAIISICREFGINEEWLRTGEGEMKHVNSKEEEITAVVRQLFEARPDSFKAALISALLKIDAADKWDLLEEIYNSVAKDLGDQDNEKKP